MLFNYDIVNLTDTLEMIICFSPTKNIIPNGLLVIRSRII